MRSTVIEQIGKNFSLVTYFNDEYTPPNYHGKSFKTRKGAEKELEFFNSLNG